ncbi:hypothetical protein C0991_001431, partial [Blastosporella zonata]
MASSSSTLLPSRADFASRLHSLSLAVPANLSYAAASGDEDSTREALEFAAEALLSWEEHPAHLFDVEWAGAEDISAAAQALWEEWSEADWSMTAPFGCFFEGSPPRDEDIMGDGGEMAMASSVQKAGDEVSAAWASPQEKGTGRAKRAERRASKRKA